jgi:hypothetical protein
MCRVDIPGFHGAVDLALDGDRLYLTAPATESIYVFDILDDSPEPPTAEFNLTIAPVEGEIQLRWDRVEGAETYHLYRSSTIQFESQNTVDLGAVTDTFYLDAEAVQQYDWRFYRIDAVMLPGVCNIPEIPSGPPLLNDPRREASLVTHHDEPHNVANGVNCASCHYTHYPYPEPFPTWWFGEHLCKSCHVETGMSQAQLNHLAGNSTIFCNACHDPHDQQQPFGHYFIRDVVLTPNSGWRSVTFADATDFVHGSPDYDGICEVCHTQTLYYRNNASGDHDHHAGEDCMTCHSHEHGFSTPAD